MSNAKTVYRIGFIGPEYCTDKEKKIQELLFKIKNSFNDSVIIISGGNKNGFERYVRKHAIRFEMQYKEFNPLCTNWNTHSAMKSEFYDRPYHFSHYIYRYQIMLKSIDRLILSKTTFSEMEKLFKNIEQKLLINRL